MAEKLTLTTYLERRGTCKTLTRIEAEAFGVPYPLVSGWPVRFGAVEITQAMLKDLATRIQTARRSTASKARRGLDGAEGRVQNVPAPIEVPACTVAAPLQRNNPAIFPGFARRLARRARDRQVESAPWT